MRQLEQNMNFISSLADDPAMATSALKQEFDKAGNVIKTYINDTLLDDIVDADESTATSVLEQVDELLDDFEEELEGEMNTFKQEVNGSLNTMQQTITGMSGTVGSKTTYTDFYITAAPSSSFSMSPNSEYNDTITATLSGYYPIGVVGFHWLRTNVDVDILRTELTSRTNGRAVVSFKAQSHSNYSTSGHLLWVNILWVKVR